MGAGNSVTVCKMSFSALKFLTTAFILPLQICSSIEDSCSSNRIQFDDLHNNKDCQKQTTMNMHLKSISSDLEQCRNDDFSACLEVPWNPDSMNASSLPQYNLTPDSIQMKNFGNGTLEVWFPLPPYNMFPKYILSLFVNEAALTHEQCSHFSLTRHTVPLMHSEKIFDVVDCDELDLSPSECTPTCNRTGTVTFQYVFSGCYIVMITPDKGRYEKSSVFSPSRMIESSYKKRPVWNMTPTVVEQCRLSEKGTDRRLTITLSDFSILFNERLAVVLRLKKDTCVYHDTIPEVISWVVALTLLNPGFFFLFTEEKERMRNILMITISHELNGKVPIEFKLFDLGTSKLDSCGRQGHVLLTFELGLKDGDLACFTKFPNKPSCSLIGDTIECHFKNVAPGNYCITIDPQDKDRCSDKGNVWTLENGDLKFCLFYWSFECKSATGNVSVPLPLEKENGNSILIIVGAAIACIIIAVVIYLGIRSYFRRVGGIRREMEPVPDLMPAQPKVLLLYAQDCEPFMKLMTTFRKLLVDMGKCKVLDCFDPALTEDIAASPNEWMHYWASHPDVKVVVVASDCAAAHQKALTANINLQYREPKPFNHLFLAGLKEVTFKKKEYLSIFVVKFDDKDLNYLTPYRRFVLPLYLQELLKSLNPGIDVAPLADNKSEQLLRDNHNDLKYFKRQNPKYLTHMMIMSQECV